MERKLQPNECTISFQFQDPKEEIACHEAIWRAIGGKNAPLGSLKGVAGKFGEGEGGCGAREVSS